MLLYEMMVGRPPFDGDDDNELFDNILKVSKFLHYACSCSRKSD